MATFTDHVTGDGLANQHDDFEGVHAEAGDEPVTKAKLARDRAQAKQKRMRARWREEGIPKWHVDLMEDGADDFFLESCRRGDIQMVKYGIGIDTDPNIHNVKGETPLHMAAICGGPPGRMIATLLIEEGADRTAKRRSDGFTPFMVAEARGQAEMMDVLKPRDGDDAAEVHSTTAFIGGALGASVRRIATLRHLGRRLPQGLPRRHGELPPNLTRPTRSAPQRGPGRHPNRTDAKEHDSVMFQDTTPNQHQDNRHSRDTDWHRVSCLRCLNGQCTAFALFSHRRWRLSLWRTPAC